jgi:hypothetical protein
MGRRSSAESVCQFGWSGRMMGIVYTETYEKPVGDLLSVQKNIAADAALSTRNLVDGAKNGAN